MTKSMFPPVWDSTMISALRSCPQKFNLSYVDHWKPHEESVHLVAGGAFAAGIEAARIAFYVDGASPADAEGSGIQALLAHYGNFQPPPDSAKTLERMCGALEFYFANYPLGKDGAVPITFGDQRGIEFSFSVPLPVNHPESGLPLLFAGRADMIADAFGGKMLFDEKTTSSLGASWGRQWDLRSQFTGYMWAAKEYGLDVKGAVVRGISILKTKYDTQQILTYRPQWMIDRWMYQVERDLRRAIEMHASGYWDYNLDHSCVEYGGCSFREVCLSPDPMSWLPVKFTPRVWDPISREPKTPQEWEAQWRAKA